MQLKTIFILKILILMVVFGDGSINVWNSARRVVNAATSSHRRCRVLLERWFLSKVEEFLAESGAGLTVDPFDRVPLVAKFP